MFFVHITAMRSASRYGRSRSTTARRTLKMAVLAPTPSASVSTATAAKPGLLRERAQAELEILEK